MKLSIQTSGWRDARLTAPYYTVNPQPRPLSTSYIRGLPGNAALIPGGTTNFYSEIWYERSNGVWGREVLGSISDHSTFYLYSVMNWICCNFVPEENIGIFPTTNETDARNARFGGSSSVENAANDAWEHYFPDEEYSISGLFPSDWHRLLPMNSIYLDDASKILSSLTWRVNMDFLPDAQGRIRKTYDIYNIRGN